MSKGAVAPSGHAEASPTAIYPDDLEPELRATLSVLARIETQYEQERGDLERCRVRMRPSSGCRVSLRSVIAAIASLTSSAWPNSTRA